MQVLWTEVVDQLRWSIFTMHWPLISWAAIVGKT